MFPVALAAANHQALDFRPFAYTLMMGASAGFMTPTACPTNLMVYSPGGYKFSDYIHFGGPLQVFFVTMLCLKNFLTNPKPQDILLASIIHKAIAHLIGWGNAALALVCNSGSDNDS